MLQRRAERVAHEAQVSIQGRARTLRFLHQAVVTQAVTVAAQHTVQPGDAFGAFHSVPRAKCSSEDRWESRADDWNSSLSSPRLERRLRASNVGCRATDASVPERSSPSRAGSRSDSRRPSSGMAILKRGLPASGAGFAASTRRSLPSIVGQFTTQAPIAGAHGPVGGIYRPVCAIQTSARKIERNAMQGAGEPRSACVAEIAAVRAGHIGLRRGSAFSLVSNRRCPNVGAQDRAERDARRR
jgi:hypothetical protein